jgi:hypothetical protein
MLTALRTTTRLLALSGLLAVSLGACTAQLISEYDELTDRRTSEVEEKVEGLLVRLERAGVTSDPADGAFGTFAQDYDEIEVDLRLLETRANCFQQNERTVEQIQGLRASVNALREAHKAKSERTPPDELSAQAIAILRQPLEQQFRAILTLELAKKRE